MSSSDDVIWRYERDIEREEIVDLHGKEAFYKNPTQLRYNKSERQRRALKINKEKKRLQNIKIQKEKEKEKEKQAMDNILQSMAGVQAERKIADCWEDLIDKELDSNQICQICLEEYEDFEKKIKLTCCGHEYHEECLAGMSVKPASLRGKWNNIRFKLCSCPNCRSDFRKPEKNI